MSYISWMGNENIKLKDVAAPVRARVMLACARYGQPRSYERSHRRGAFTLIEMLVVIGVIAILAGIIIGALPAAQNKSARSRVRVELKALEAAIDSYKAKNNFYPPSNFKEGFPNTLFYELTGTLQEPDPAPPALKYRSIAAPDHVLRVPDLNNVFNISGFINSAPSNEVRDVPIFYKDFQTQRKVRDMESNGVTFKALVASRRGMDRQPAVFHYNAVSPTNNVGEFDLWVEIELRGEPIIIGNWDK